MTITYTYQYRFIPRLWKCPTPPSITEQEDMLKTLEYRRLVAVYLRDWVYVLNTWRMAIKYSIPPLLLAYFLGFFGWVTLFMLLVMVGILSFLIWARIRAYHGVIAMIEIVIDEVLNNEFGIQLPEILDNE